MYRPDRELFAESLAFERCRRSTVFGVAWPWDSRGGLCNAMICEGPGFLCASAGMVGKSAAGPIWDSESSKASGAGVPSFSPSHSKAPATFLLLPSAVADICDRLRSRSFFQSFLDPWVSGKIERLDVPGVDCRLIGLGGARRRYCLESP